MCDKGVNCTGEFESYNSKQKVEICLLERIGFTFGFHFIVLICSYFWLEYDFGRKIKLAKSVPKIKKKSMAFPVGWKLFGFLH